MLYNWFIFKASSIINQILKQTLKFLLIDLSLSSTIFLTIYLKKLIWVKIEINFWQIVYKSI